MSENQTAILFLEKESIYFFDSVKITKMDFTPETVADLDITGEDKFVNSIFTFIDHEKISPSHYLFVISESALFVGDTLEKDPVKVDIEFKNFTNMVPYNNTLSKKYAVGEGSKIVATNMDLINIIREAFAQKGFVCTDVVPALVFGQVGIKTGFDMEMATYMVKNQKFASDKSMSEPQIVAPVNVFKVTKGKSTMLPMLIGVFAFMILALVMLLIFRK